MSKLDQKWQNVWNNHYYREERKTSISTMSHGLHGHSITAPQITQTQLSYQHITIYHAFTNINRL